MTDKLKEFVNRNKKEFDTEAPSKDLWNKIDSQIEVKNASWISSKWLSKLKYFGLSASVLVIAAYFISQGLGNSSSNELAQNIKDSAMSNSGEWVKANHKPGMNRGGSANSEENKIKTRDDKPVTEETNPVQSNVEPKKDSVISKPAENNSADINKTAVSSVPKEETPNITPVNEKKETVIKKSEAVSEEKMNSYRCTIWDGASFCSVVKGFKFPGQVSIDGKIETMACSKLGDIDNLKAVWVKGKTSKELDLSFSEGFKNIVIQKSDGTKITPVAISHYYKGLGVISGYKGKRFEMIFKDKVEMILFFKNVEEGDKIIIDKTIEAVVKSNQ